MRIYIIFALLLMSTIGAAIQQSPLPDVVEQIETPKKQNVYIVKAYQPLSAEQQLKLSYDLQASTIDRLTPYNSSYFKRVYRLETNQVIDISKFTHPLIAKIETPTEVISFEDTGSEVGQDPLLQYQWAVKNTGQVVQYDIDDITIGHRAGLKNFDIDLPTEMPKFDRPVRIAVVDYGVDIDHPDLKSIIDTNDAECTNGIIPLNPKDDKDKNGYIGDCKGWNFTGSDKVGSNKQIDDSGHGTHVAGIMGAIINNDTGIQGVSNNIRILPLKVLSNDNEKKNAQGFTDRITRAILYAVSRKVDVINLSLGWPLFLDKEHIREALLEAERQGVLIVAAAGNNSHSAPILPCALSSVLCVGSVNNDGSVSNFSNYGAHVDVLAPGGHILSTVPTAINSLWFSVVGYDYKDGTSQSAPYVAALAGLLKAQNKTATNDTIRNQIVRTSKPLDKSIAKTNKFFRAGVISFARALKNELSNPLTINLKEQHRYLSWSTNNKVSQWSLPIKNHTDKEQVLDLVISPANNNTIDIVPHQQIKLQPQELKLITVPLNIIDITDESEIILKITAKNSEVSVEQLAHLQLIRKIDQDPAIIKYKLPKTVGFNLFTLKSFSQPIDTPIYYELKPSKDKTVFRLIQLGDNGDAKIIANHSLPLLERTLLIRGLDVNADGDLDVQIIAMVKEGEERKIVYFHFPLMQNGRVFNNIADWNKLDLELEGALEVEATLQHALIKIDNKFYNAPFFMTMGPLPERDQPLDQFQPRVTGNAQYIYYFVPELKDKKWILTTRVVNSPDRIQKWMKALKLKAFTDIRFLHMLPATEPSKIRILTSIGYDFNRKNYIANIKIDDVNNITVQWQELGNSTSIDNFALDNTIPLDGGQQESILIGQVNDNLWLSARLNDNNNYQSRLSPIDNSEILNSYLKSYRKNNLLFNFMQTISEILLVTFDGNKILQDSTSFHVSTFLPGQLYQERSFPIWFGTDNKQPALYVDSTQIVSRTASLIVADDNGKLKTPMDMAIEVPLPCIANNPTLWHNTEYRFSFLCRSANSSASQPMTNVEKNDSAPTKIPPAPEFELWFLPMK
jgi:cell wall-associated protease